MPAAVILADNKTIVAVLQANADVDPLPTGYPQGAWFKNAPLGCNESWTHDPETGGFVPPPPPTGVLVDQGIDF